jgi:hypothetical protein
MLIKQQRRESVADFFEEELSDRVKMEEKRERVSRVGEWSLNISSSSPTIL